MTNMNPEIVIDNVIDNETIKTSNNIKLYPLSIRRYCFLEKLKSPFIYKDKSFDVENIVPTAYVLHCSPQKLKTYTTKDIDRFVSDAFDWSDTLRVSDIPKIIEEISIQINHLNEAAPETTSNSHEENVGGKKN